MTDDSKTATAVAGPALSEGLGAGAETRGCDNCGKRGPWQTENGTGKNKAMTYELAECHHYPKPAWWRNAGPLWVAHGCGSCCQVWAPVEAPNVRGKPDTPARKD